jgi:hypothetical protein
LAEYRSVGLNLLSRSINIDKDRLNIQTEKLRNMTNADNLDDRINAKILLKELETELNNYEFYKANNSSKTIRRMVFTEQESINSMTCLFTDTFHNLVDLGTVNYDFNKPYLNIYDFSEHLDICLATVFDIDYYTVYQRLLCICSKYNITMKTLSRIFLVCSADISDDIDFEIGDIFDLANNITQYVQSLIKENYEKNIPMLDLIDVKSNLKKFFPTVYGKDKFQELLLAIRLQIAYKMLTPVISTMMKYQNTMGADALIFSKHLFGFTINSSSVPNTKLYITIRGEKIPIPYKVIDWKKGLVI